MMVINLPSLVKILQNLIRQLFISHPCPESMKNIALLVCLVGLLLLYVIAEAEEEDTMMDFISSEDGDGISLRGEIKEIDSHESHTRMIIQTDGMVDAVAFEESFKEEYGFSQGDIVAIEGDVSESEYGKSLIVERMEKIID